MGVDRFFGEISAIAAGANALVGLVTGCSTTVTVAPDGGEDASGIHRLDGGMDALIAYDGPTLTACTTSSLGVTLDFGDGGGAVAQTEGGTDGAADGGLEGGEGSGADASGGASAAGTTGKPCKSDADCNGNICELSDPTPICQVPPMDPVTGANCDPGTDGKIHFCDGPDVSTSPGTCIAFNNPPVAGQGICLQACTYAPNGQRALGCTGNNACNPNPAGLFLQANSGSIVGLGFFGTTLIALGSGGCMVDSDCRGPNGKCIVEFGLCNDVLSPTPESDCNCPTNGSSGFCAQSCVVGGTAQCPAGTICDALEPNAFVGANMTPIPGFTAQNAGLAGFCFPSCAAGGTCPSGASCLQQTAAGSDCQP